MTISATINKSQDSGSKQIFRVPLALRTPTLNKITKIKCAVPPTFQVRQIENTTRCTTLSMTNEMGRYWNVWRTLKIQHRELSCNKFEEHTFNLRQWKSNLNHE